MNKSFYQHITITNMPEEERPREKLAKYGAKHLTTAELMAIVIRTGNKSETAISLAQRILNAYDNDLTYFMNSSIEELINNEKLRGIGPAKAAQILASIELGKRINHYTKKSKVISCPTDVAEVLMEDMRYLKQEFFKIILLNTKNRIISIDNVTIGTLDASLVHPREVFKRAISKSSSNIILVHNHPSGDPTPSEADKKITRRLLDAGEIIGIKVIDHIIIGNGKYLSFKEKGIL